MDLKALRHNWEEFARYDPMWAILTDPKRRRKRWKPEEFFETGRQEIASLMDSIKGRGYQFGKERALDFGCGVGRLTQAMAQYFENCYGVDISAEMVERAKSFNRHGDRCQYFVNQSDNLKIFEDNSFDFIYTNIVLQHIEKKYNEFYLKEFIRLLKPNGLLVFQMPSSLKPDYRPITINATWFLKMKDRLQHFLKRLGVRTGTLYRWGLADIPAVMEMHCFEKSELEGFIKDNGATILDVERYDVSGPAFISYRYYVTKKS